MRRSSQQARLPRPAQHTVLPAGPLKRCRRDAQIQRGLLQITPPYLAVTQLLHACPAGETGAEFRTSESAPDTGN